MCNYHYILKKYLSYPYLILWLISKGYKIAACCGQSFNVKFKLYSVKREKGSIEPPLSALSCLLYHKGQQSEEWECLREISININKLLIVCFVYVRPCRVVVACLFVYPLFYTALCCCLFLCPLIFLYWCCWYIFCLFINHVNKPIIFVFGTFVYHFKNTISIFATILLYIHLRSAMNRFFGTHKYS